MTCNAQVCPEYAKFVGPKDARIATLEGILEDIEDELSGVLRVGGCTPDDFEALSSAVERIDEICTGAEEEMTPSADLKNGECPRCHTPDQYIKRTNDGNPWCRACGYFKDVDGP